MSKLTELNFDNPNYFNIEDYQKDLQEKADNFGFHSVGEFDPCWIENEDIINNCVFELE